MSGQKCDIILIGAGPANIFAALHLADKGYKVVFLEKGHGLEKRSCPKKKGQCVNCVHCAILNGWGGAGAYSDGKLTLSTGFGGALPELIGEDQAKMLIKRADEIYLSFGAPMELHGTDEKVVQRLRQRAAAAELELIPSPIRHLGTENCYKILDEMKRTLEKKADIRFNEAASEILVEGGRVKGVKTACDKQYDAGYVICGPGRQGSPWMYSEAQRLGLELFNNPVDIGVRVELPAGVMEPISSRLYESKFIYYSPSFDDKVRTFCMNPYGEVVLENSEGVITVNGQS